MSEPLPDVRQSPSGPFLTDVPRILDQGMQQINNPAVGAGPTNFAWTYTAPQAGELEVSVCFGIQNTAGGAIATGLYVAKNGGPIPVPTYPSNALANFPIIPGAPIGIGEYGQLSGTWRIAVAAGDVIGVSPDVSTPVPLVGTAAWILTSH